MVLLFGLGGNGLAQAATQSGQSQQLIELGMGGTTNTAAPNAATTIINADFKKSIRAEIAAMQTAGIALAPTLVQMGKDLLAIFFAIMLAWYIFEGMAERQMDVMFKKIINHIFIGMIALEMLLGWTGSSGIGVSNFLTNGLNELSMPFSTAGNPSNQVIDVYWKAITSVLGVIGNLFNGMGFWRGAKLAGELALQSIVPVGMEQIAIGMFLAYIALVIVVSLVCAATLLLAMLYSLLFIQMGDFIIYLGLAVGPVFVATLVFPPASNYFTKWLEFVISGGMYKLVAVVIGALMAPLFAAINDNSVSVVVLDSAWVWEIGKNILGFLVYGAIMFFWSVLAYAMAKQIPGFVHALAGGMHLHVSSLSSMAPSFVPSAAKAPAGMLGGKEGEDAGGQAGTSDNKTLTATAKRSPSTALVVGAIKEMRKARKAAAKAAAKVTKGGQNDTQETGDDE